MQQSITRTLSLMQDAETGQRGFLLTKDAAYLEPHTLAVAAIEPQLNALETMVSDNAGQVERLNQLRREVAARLGIIARSILTVATLRELGYVVVHASTPMAALEKIRTPPRIDLLFSDVVMPEMNGKQMADKGH